MFYAWQARRLAEREGRDDVTAIPFGINTPTIFAYVFLIMAPIYQRTHDATLAWQAGVFASLISGVVQTGGAFCMDWFRRHTPKAALLAPLAGLSLAYLCLGFVFGVFQQAAIGLFPMIVLFALYGSKLRLPWRLPPALVAIGVGAVLVAVLRAVHLYNAPLAPMPRAGLSAACGECAGAAEGEGVVGVSGDYSAAGGAGYAGFPADSGEHQVRGG